MLASCEPVPADGEGLLTYFFGVGMVGANKNEGFSKLLFRGAMMALAIR